MRSRMRAAVLVAVLAVPLLVACTGDVPIPGPSTPATSPPQESPAPDPGRVPPHGQPPQPATPAPPPAPAPAPPAVPPPAGPTVPASLRGLDLERIPTSERIVALTFDAGANADAVAPILATLAAEGITATFFLTGDFVRKFPAQSRAIVQAGHRLGNHSATHPGFTSLTDSQLRAEVRGAEADIVGQAGADPRPLFRFPFGDRDARRIALVNDLGYVPVRWTVDTLGWQGTSGGRSAAEVTRRVLDTARPGQIVLMHVGSHPNDGSTLDADALPSVISGLRARGYRFVTLDVLLPAG